MILATALVASLRISEAITASKGIFVNRFKVGIAELFLLLAAAAVEEIRRVALKLNRIVSG